MTEANRVFFSYGGGSPIVLELADGHSNLEALLKIGALLSTVLYERDHDGKGLRTTIAVDAQGKAELLETIDYAVSALGDAVRLYGILLSSMDEGGLSVGGIIELGFVLSGLGALTSRLTDARGHVEDAEPIAAPAPLAA